MSVKTSPIHESIILSPYTHLYNKAEKSVVLAWVEDMNTIIKAPHEVVEVIKEVYYMIYRSVALTDDVIDNSQFRGKIPTAHEVFGVPHSLTASWMSFFMATERLLELKQPKAVELLAKNMRMVYEGQTIELLWRDSFHCPTEEEFHQMAIKTGHGLAIVTDLLQLFAHDQRDLTKLLKLLSLYYQARDDIGDLQLGKVQGYCEDTNEGKFGFPLVVAINRHPEKLDKGKIAAGMADRTSRGSYIESLLKESDALVCCKKILKELATEIRMELNALGGSAIADSLLAVRFDP